MDAQSQETLTEIETYKSIINDYIEQYRCTCKDENIENTSSNKFTAILIDLCNLCFRDPETGKSKLNLPNLAKSGKLYILYDILDIYVYISLSFNKVITLNNFLLFTGIPKTSLYRYDEVLTTINGSIVESIQDYQETSLFNKTADGSIMSLALGKIKHGWIEGEKVQYIKAIAQTTDTIADKYKDIKELPKF